MSDDTPRPNPFTPGSFGEVLLIAYAKAILREDIDPRPVTYQAHPPLGRSPALVVPPPVLQVVGPPATEVAAPVLLFVPPPAPTAEPGRDAAGRAVVPQVPHPNPLDEVQA